MILSITGVCICITCWRLVRLDTQILNRFNGSCGLKCFLERGPALVKNKSNRNSTYHRPGLCVCVFFQNPEGRCGIPKKHTTGFPGLVSFGASPGTTLPCPVPSVPHAGTGLSWWTGRPSPAPCLPHALALRERPWHGRKVCQECKSPSSLV